jgi:hypothetical protein
MRLLVSNRVKVRITQHEVVCLRLVVEEPSGELQAEADDEHGETSQGEERMKLAWVVDEGQTEERVVDASKAMGQQAQ